MSQHKSNFYWFIKFYQSKFWNLQKWPLLSTLLVQGITVYWLRPFRSSVNLALLFHYSKHCTLKACSSGSFPGPTKNLLAFSIWLNLQTGTGRGSDDADWPLPPTPTHTLLQSECVVNYTQKLKIISAALSSEFISHKLFNTMYVI